MSRVLSIVGGSTRTRSDLAKEGNDVESTTLADHRVLPLTSRPQTKRPTTLQRLYFIHEPSGSHSSFLDTVRLNISVPRSVQRPRTRPTAPEVELNTGPQAHHDHLKNATCLRMITLITATCVL